MSEYTPADDLEVDGDDPESAPEPLGDIDLEAPVEDVLEQRTGLGTDADEDYSRPD